MVKGEKESIYSLIDSAKVVSFDIFDTLLLRPFVKPTDLFLYMEDKYNAPGFAEKREIAERTARENLTGSEEISLLIIYNNIPEYAYCMELELDEERTLLLSNHEVKEWYDYALKNGKRIIITSDIYLPEDFIINVLKKNGYEGYEKLYLSSTYGKVKWKGSLYCKILQDLNIHPKEILHIGDNYSSDYEIPKSLGMAAIFYEKYIDRYLKLNPKAREYLKRYGSDYVVSTTVMQMAIRNSFGYANYWEKFGYEYAGFICFFFARWLDRQIDIEYPDTKDILFVARDGYLLKKTYDIISSHNIRTHYIYAPRKMGVLCLLNYDSPDPLIRFNAMKTIISYYGLYSEGNLTINTAEEIINNNFRKIKALADKELSDYKTYLTGLGLESSKTVMVDSITGAFTSQKLLSAAIGSDVPGLYWLVLPDVESIKGQFAFTSFAHGKNTGGFGTISWDIMEFILSAPEPPVEKFTHGRPEYKEQSKEEDFRIQTFLKFSPSVHEFTKDFLNNPILNFRSLNYSAVYGWIEIFMNNPDSKDKEEFKNIYHAYDQEHSKYRTLISAWYDTPELKDRHRGTLERIKYAKYLAIHDRAVLMVKLKNKLKQYIKINGRRKSMIQIKSILPVSSRSFHERLNYQDLMLRGLSKQLEETIRQSDNTRQQLSEIQQLLTLKEQQTSDMQKQLAGNRQQLLEIQRLLTLKEQQISDMQEQLAVSQQQLSETRQVSARIEENLSMISYGNIMRGIESQLAAVIINNYSFLPYKDKFCGRTVVLCGAGPTLSAYEPIQNAVHIALNRAFLFDKVDFDFVFASDFRGIEHVKDELKNYRVGKCEKFFAFMNDQELDIPESYAKECNAKRFMTKHYWRTMYGGDWRNTLYINQMPLEDYPTIALIAIQFILYTHPQKIYLVGCDFSAEGHFNERNQTKEKIDWGIREAKRLWSNDLMRQWWSNVKEFQHCYYPDTEIVSINPIGLKGIFKDEYTDSYLAKHHDIEK